MKVLDLFCCEGGAAVGYHRAGFTPTGVDNEKKRLKWYPYTSHHGDAYDYLDAHGHEYDLIHASPPCQWYTRGNAPRRGTDSKWDRTIPPIREALQATGRPYVIENVKDAIWDLRDPIMFCGCMFNLNTFDSDGIRLHLQRPRVFETSWTIPNLVPGRVRVNHVYYPVRVPRPCDHTKHEWVAGVYGGARRDKYEARYIRKGGYVPKEKHIVQALMGLDHPMTWTGMYESVPPRYTFEIGMQAKALLGGGGVGAA